MGNLVAKGADAFANGYSIKRYGLTLSDCDSEPVQTPGCVQAHGALLVLRTADLTIVQASDNLETVLGHSVNAVLGQPASIVLGTDGEAQLRVLLDGPSIERNALYLLTLAYPRAAAGCGEALDVTAHTIDGVVLLEFEPTGRMQSLNHDYFALVNKPVARLQTATTLLHFCNLAAQEIRTLTGMDRVMVYKFHADGHGEVFAESTQPGLSPWLGLHYPAEDIPRPAREVFRRTWLRPIPDMSDRLAEMVPLLNPDTGKPLDMTHCFLRGVSKMCTEYYRNMGVAATLTMSIRRGDDLWGLISCLHYEEPIYHSYQIRAACEFFAQVISLQHGAAQDREDHAYQMTQDNVHQQLLAQVVRKNSLTALVTGDTTLLDGFDASGAALYHAGIWYTIGKTPSEVQLDRLGTWISTVKLPSMSQPMFDTDALMKDYPAAAEFANVASGLVALSLSPDGRDLVLWCRPETMQTISWGGVPHDKTMVTGPNGPRLTPRVSFELFVESVHQRALPWKQVELVSLKKLQRQLTETMVERAQLHASLNVELARSTAELDAFTYVATHDLKEPLRGIHQYAFQLMQNAELLQSDDRSKLDRIVRLALRMDSLLNSLLHFSSIGKGEPEFEQVDLNEIVREALDMSHSGAEAPVALIVARLLPSIRCNRGWCREIFVHLLSNAVRYTDAASRRIEVGAILPGEAHLRPGCPPGAEHVTIFFVADNGIGIRPTSFKQIFKLFKRLHGRDEYGGGLGTGLTMVRKLVERHQGKVWLDSVHGDGTTFYFTLSDQGAADANGTAGSAR